MRILSFVSIPAICEGPYPSMQSLNILFTTSVASSSTSHTYLFDSDFVYTYSIKTSGLQNDEGDNYISSSGTSTENDNITISASVEDLNLSNNNGNYRKN